MKILSNKKIKQYKDKIDSVMEYWGEAVRFGRETVDAYDNLLISYEDIFKDNIDYLGLLNEMAKINGELFFYAKQSNEIRSLAKVEDPDKIYFPQDIEEQKRWEELKYNVEMIRKNCDIVLKDKFGKSKFNQEKDNKLEVNNND